MDISNIQKRFILFLVGCLGARLGITYIASIGSEQILKLMAIATAVTSVVWLVLFFGGYRKTGPEVFGSEIWWNSLRPVHAFMFMLFSIKVLGQLDLPVLNQIEPWHILLCDTLVGLVAFLTYHGTH